MTFIKYHGLGNDFVFLVPDGGETAALTPEAARRICRRGFGVGADGLMTAGPSDRAHLSMLLLNSDGSTPEMCGNGIRCLVKAAVDVLGHRDNPLLVDTPGGVRACRWTRGADGRIAEVSVDMGAPSFDRARVPMLGEGSALHATVRVAGRAFEGHGVNTGNPHFVIFGDADRALARELGPALGAAREFPEGANIEFAALEAPDRLRVVVWERGCGLTEACGTGATATVAAAAATGRAAFDAPITVILPGGELQITVEEGFRTAWMTGPAVEVYRGRLSG